MNKARMPTMDSGKYSGQSKVPRLLKVLLVVVMVIAIFSGSRCEKQQKVKPTGIPRDAAAAQEDPAREPEGDALQAPDPPPGEAGADVPPDAFSSGDSSIEASDAADAPSDGAVAPEAKKITFKKIPKIPSFKPWPEQPVADPKELEYLTDHAGTCKILAEADWTKREGMKTLVPMKRERIADSLAWRFQILLALSETDEPITGFFKPRQENYWDWLKEVHAYNIGELIGAPTVPTVLRFWSKKKFSWWLGKTPPEETTMFKWEGKKEPKIRGALKYWVPSYTHRRFGKKIANEEYMNAIAASLHPANKEKLRKEYPLYLELGRGIVFDYLIINEDRPENLGTILLPDGSYKLVLIDNGLALGVEHGGRTVMKKMFKSMRIFPKDMIDRIRALDDAQVAELLRPKDDPVMWLPEVCITQLLKRRDDIVSTVDGWYAKWGDIIWY
jgi:hypothetical protein